MPDSPIAIPSPPLAILVYFLLEEWNLFPSLYELAASRPSQALAHPS